MLSVFV